MPIKIPRSLVEFILLGPEDDRRQLQDSPILGDVWVEFAKNPAQRLELLITPYKETSAGAVARTLAGDAAACDDHRSADRHRVPAGHRRGPPHLRRDPAGRPADHRLVERPADRHLAEGLLHRTGAPRGRARRDASGGGEVARGHHRDLHSGYRDAATLCRTRGADPVGRRSARRQGRRDTLGEGPGAADRREAQRDTGR